MQTESLKEFIAVLKDRQAGDENSVRTLQEQEPIHGKQIQDLLTAIPQAHINELDFVIEGLERIVSEG